MTTLPPSPPSAPESASEIAALRRRVAQRVTNEMVDAAVKRRYELDAGLMTDPQIMRACLEAALSPSPPAEERESGT
jgi:hypothetical protein